MLDKAKQMEEEDQKILEKINSKNSLESYLFSIKNSIKQQQEFFVKFCSKLKCRDFLS